MANDLRALPHKPHTSAATDNGMHMDNVTMDHDPDMSKINGTNPSMTMAGSEPMVRKVAKIIGDWLL